MELFKSYKIFGTDQNRIVILYLNNNLTEFSNELGLIDEDKEKLNESARSYIKKMLPNLKVNTVKVMIGSILISMFSLGVEDVAASGETTIAQSQAKSTVDYQVKTGDTLYFISQRFQVTVTQIKTENQLTTDLIYPGQILKIPVKTASVNPIHDVVAGDTLYKIAQQYSVSVSQIKEANRLTSNMIYPGQRLEIPTNAGTNPITTSQNNHSTTYTIKSGDTLYKISQQYNMTVAQLMQLNNLTSTMIYPGQVLKVTHGAPTSSVLAIGSSGAQVEAVQSNLKTLGFFIYPKITGYYGEVTAGSVYSFQTAYGIPATGKVDESTETEIEHALVKRKLVNDTLNYKGVPYVWGGETPAGFDCSGFIYYMFQKYGVNIERTSSEQLFTMGKWINKDNLQPGDLVFFGIEEPGEVSHAGFYIGNNKFISATTSNGIWTYAMDHVYWSQYYLGAKRIY